MEVEDLVEEHSQAGGISPSIDTVDTIDRDMDNFNQIPYYLSEEVREKVRRGQETGIGYFLTEEDISSSFTKFFGSPQEDKNFFNDMIEDFDRNYKEHRALRSEYLHEWVDFSRRHSESGSSEDTVDKIDVSPPKMSSMTYLSPITIREAYELKKVAVPSSPSEQDIDDRDNEMVELTSPITSPVRYVQRKLPTVQRITTGLSPELLRSDPPIQQAEQPGKMLFLCFFKTFTKHLQSTKHLLIFDLFLVTFLLILVRRQELLDAIEALLTGRHHLTSVILTRDAIKRDKAARRRNGESSSSSDGSSHDLFTNSDGVESVDWNSNFQEETSRYSRTTGHSVVRFEATFGGKKVSGFIFGALEPSYMKMSASSGFEHENIQPIVYNVPLMDPCDVKYREILRNRLLCKRVVMWQKKGVSLNKGLYSASTYGVTRFVRDFTKQFFDLLSYIHAKGFCKYWFDFSTSAQTLHNLNLNLIRLDELIFYLNFFGLIVLCEIHPKMFTLILTQRGSPRQFLSLKLRDCRKMEKYRQGLKVTVDIFVCRKGYIDASQIPGYIHSNHGLSSQFTYVSSQICELYVRL